MDKNNKKNIKYSIIGIIIILLIIVIIIFNYKNNKVTTNLNLNEVSSNYKIDDSTIMSLYYKFHPEKDLLFNLIGSDTNKDYYAHYYRNNKIDYKEIESVVKNTILLNDADYKTGQYDEEKRCYYMSKEDFKVIYQKIFGKEDYDLNFNKNYSLEIQDIDEKICIGEPNIGSYNNVIDTYMINAINKTDSITIYERVAFIEIDEKYLYFYKDYKKNNLVYKLKVTNELDRTFINNPELVSNVLLEYQNDFQLYEYTYIKGLDYYYLESINKA